MTNADQLDLNKSYYGNKQRNLSKPNGLWYSWNNEWLDWCTSEMPDWKKPWLFYLYPILDDVLIISNTSELIQFQKDYAYKNYDVSAFMIKWKLVAKDYKGIEIRNYHSLKWNDYTQSRFMEYIWLAGWDVSGGCIWDLSIIKKVRRYKNA